MSEDEFKLTTDSSLEDLLPLIQQNLSLKQQVESLAAQNKLMHERENANLRGNQQQGLPSIHAPGSQGSHTRSSSTSSNQSQLMGGRFPHNGHNRQRSVEHTRRQSLVVSEARKAAHKRTQTPQNVADAPGSPQTPSSPYKSPARPTPVAPFGSGSPGPLAISNPTSAESKTGNLPQLETPGTPKQHRRGHSRGQSLNSGFEFKFPPSSPQVRLQSSEESQGSQIQSQHQPAGPQAPQTQPAAQSQQTLLPPGMPNTSGFRHNRSQSVNTHRRTGSWRSDVNPNFGHKHAESIDTNQYSQSRRQLFVPYLPQANIPAMVSTGLLVTGTLRVNKKNRSHAYVRTDQLDDDVFIDGSRDRNRALEGDLVAVELLNVDDVWAQKREKEERKRLRESDNNNMPVVASNKEVVARSSQKKLDDAEVEGQTLFLSDEVEWDTEKPLYSGHVVAILERPAGQLFSGTLCLLRPSSQATKERQHARRSSLSPNYTPQENSKPKIVWFKPTDKHIPLMAVPTEQAPETLLTDPNSYNDKVFVAHIKRWPITSLHPFGTLIEELGPSDDKSVATKALLRDANFPSRTLSWNSQTEMNNLVTKMVDEAQLDSFDGNDVTILANDMAASIDKKHLNVFVLDLTRYIEPHSTLNKELKSKSISIQSLPEINSPLFIDPQIAERLSFKIGKRSPAICVQIALDGSDVKISNLLVNPRNDDDFEQFKEIALKLKHNRCFESHAVWLDGFLDLDHDPTTNLSGNELPLKALVCNELEHITNTAVANELLRSKYVGLDTILRVQEEPPVQKLEQFIDLLSEYGISIETSNAGRLASSLASQLTNSKASAAAICLAKCLSPQKYSAASKTHVGHLSHYWFNSDVYTHFTRPLLRYADHLVARQVHSMLSETQVVPSTSQDCTDLTFKHDCALKAQQQAHHLHISEQLRTPRIVKGIVTQVFSGMFNVVIPDMLLEKRVYLDNLQLKSSEFVDKKQLALEWADGRKKHIELFAEIEVELQATFESIRPTIKITSIHN